MKTTLLALLTFVTVTIAEAQNENLRQYLFTRKDYVNNQLRNRDSAVISYPDPTGNLKNEETWYVWNIAGQSYLKDTRIQHNYDNSGNSIEQITQKWDGNNWINSSKVTQTYNAQGSETQYSDFYFQNNNWIEYTRFERTYNPQGIVTEFVRSDTTGGFLNARSRIVYTIDAIQRYTQSISQVSVSGNWVNDTRIVHYYTGNSTRPDSLYFYTWSNNNWSPKTKQIKKYNVLGNEVEYLGFNLVTNKPTIKSVYDYNASGLLILSEDSVWSLNNNQWVYSSKRTYAFDNKNREIELINYQSAQGSPVFNSKTTSGYAADSSTIQMISSAWINNGWQDNAQQTYFFEQRQMASDIRYIDNSNTRAYPNPFTNVAIIEFESNESTQLQLHITDLNGRTVFQKNLFAISGKNSFLWNASDANGNALPAGFYNASVISQSGAKTFKLLKQ